MHTRPAQPSDATAIYHLIDSFSHDGTLLHRPYTEICRNIATFTVVESDADQFLGCAALHIYGPHLAEIRSIVVLPDVKGHGAGGLLVQSLLQQAESRHIPSVCLFTRIPTFFEHFHFHVADRLTIRDKVKKDCQHCARRNACDETAMLLGEPPSYPVDTLLHFPAPPQLIQIHPWSVPNATLPPIEPSRIWNLRSSSSS
jgi:amino-acid N-acetyltransferase